MIDRHGSVDFRQLVALIAVAEERSFSGAGRRLGYSQSAVSQQIASLERALSHRLLERRGGQRPVALTQVGEIVLRHAKAIVSRLQAIEADIAAVESGPRGRLAVGTFQSVSARIVPELIRRFTTQFPGVDLRFRDESDDDVLFALLETGELDCAFITLPTPDGPFAAQEITADPYVLLVPADSPLAARSRPPTFDELAELPLVGHAPTVCQLRLEETLRAAGIQPQFAFRSNDNGTIQGLVAVGMGSAIVPRLTVEPNDARVVAIDLAERIPPRLIGLAWHRDRHRSPAFAAFVEVATAFAATIFPPRDRRNAA